MGCLGEEISLEMNLRQLNIEMRSIITDLGRRVMKDADIIERLRDLAEAYGKETVSSWTHPDIRGNESMMLHYCVINDRDVVFDYCVKTLGCDINFQRRGDMCTPVHLVVYHQKRWLVKTVLAHNPDLSLMNRYAEDCTVIQRSIRC